VLKPVLHEPLQQSKSFKQLLPEITHPQFPWPSHPLPQQSLPPFGEHGEPSGIQVQASLPLNPNRKHEPEQH
jgi:hypothetical protein